MNKNPVTRRGTMIRNIDETNECASIDEITLLARASCFSIFTVIAFSFLTCGVFPCVLYWSIELRSKWLYQKVKSIDEASHVLVKGRDENEEITQIEDKTKESQDLIASSEYCNKLSISKDGLLRYFQYRYQKYRWNEQLQEFVPI